jgi:hypothetical protein
VATDFAEATRSTLFHRFLAVAALFGGNPCMAALRLAMPHTEQSTLRRMNSIRISL